MKILLRIYIFLVLLISQPYASIENGVLWLKEQTLSQTTIEHNSYISTSLQSASETFITLYDLNESYDAVDIPTSELNTTEDLSRLITYYQLRGEDTAAYLEELLIHQNEDGGFGELEGYGSTVLDTAFAIRALFSIEGNRDIIEQGLNYLKRNQQEDGAWRNNIDSDTIYITMITLDSLWMFRYAYDLQSNMNLAREYLIEHQNIDGLWDENYLNALGVKVLLPLVVDKLVLEKNIDFIRNSQSPNGSWDNDIYISALSLYSLNAFENKSYESPQINENNTIIQGVITDFESGHVLSGVQIILSGANSRTLLTNSNGYYSIDNLDTGITKIHLSLDGYQSIEYTERLQENTKYTINRSLSKLSNVGNNISIFGVLNDSITGAPLSGVKIVLNGTNNRTLYSDINGKYNIEKLEPNITKIHFSLDGYVDRELNIDLKDNTRYTLDRKLNKVLIEATVNIIGGVISDTGTRISDAKVTINNLYIEDLTNSEGVYQFTGLILKENETLDLFVESDGYQNKSVFIDIKDIHNGINNISLKPIVLYEKVENNNTIPISKDISVVSGMVKDEIGNPVSNVKISISGSDISTYTNNEGFYSIRKNYSSDEMIRQDYEFMLIYSANGFISQYQRFKTEEPINTTFDVTLFAFKEANLSIEAIELDNESYDAYNPVTMFVNMHNTGTLSQEATLIVDILSDGKVIDTIEEDYQNFSLKDVRIVPNLDNERKLQWYTGIHAPGEYTAIAKLLDSSGSTLFENKKDFVINVSKKIETMSINSVEEIYYINDNKNIKPYIHLINYSNILHKIKVNYFVVSPLNNSTSIYSKEIEIKPNELTKEIYLDSIPNKFLDEGVYSLVVNIEEGVNPEVVKGDTIMILPLVRIVPEQSLDKQVILPERNQKIKIKIKIYGEQ